MDGGALPRLMPALPGVAGTCTTRRRPPSTELLRCSRHSHQSGATEAGGGSAAMAPRNERERNRVKLVNLGFQALQQHVPHGGASKKLSKVETLRSTVECVGALQRRLVEHEVVRAALARGLLTPATGQLAARAPPAASPATASLSCASSSPDGRGSLEPGSPRSTYSSEDSGCEGELSPMQRELLDFSSWLGGY
ncbi:LOW QUALITY PROTEIN: achaete-scute homolog 2 [Onychomys torridus]|uniref:LOW QUALITY PROTEIN: achaete-scute homolog 2 n=1 Tax=Onychomys torridus TaxID=38674 RepID=UPI00167F94BB|nr:LOW QUALITY PROTEIN: achaete-scute homolog 2 [Onychomys torridus]